jgi:hypothetical protein
MALGSEKSGTELTATPEYNGIQGRALELLGDGIQASVVAQTLGVTDSYITQLLADDIFRKGVVERRFQHLQKHNARDARYDQLEDKLLEKLEDTMGMLYDPMKVAKILATVNQAKRRGSGEAGSISQQNVVVNLTLPNMVVERFKVTKDTNNQIIEAGEQTLVTIQSGTLLENAKAKFAAQAAGVQDGEQQNGITAVAITGST